MQKRRLPKFLSMGCLTGVRGLAAVLGISGVPHDPYPPGILPSDLDSEIARVQGDCRRLCVGSSARGLDQAELHHSSAA